MEKKKIVKLDKQALDLEIIALCKKYKLDKVIFVSEISNKNIGTCSYKQILANVNCTDDNVEKELSLHLKEFLTHSGLNPRAFEFAACALKREHERIYLDEREKTLTKSEKIKLKKIRDSKNKHVLLGEYEKASEYRKNELELLGHTKKELF